MATAIERFAQMERCRQCHTVLPAPPAPRACENCGAVKVTPRHGEWPRSLKTFLLIEYAKRHLFPSFRSMQDSWELLLTGAFQSKQVNGQFMRHGAAPDDLFALGVQQAEEWRLAGAVTDFL